MSFHVFVETTRKVPAIKHANRQDSQLHFPCMQFVKRALRDKVTASSQSFYSSALHKLCNYVTIFSNKCRSYWQEFRRWYFIKDRTYVNSTFLYLSSRNGQRYGGSRLSVCLSVCLPASLCVCRLVCLISETVQWTSIMLENGNKF